MFKSLELAKQLGAVSFQWSDTSVIVSGLSNLLSDSQVLGICLIGTDPSDRVRSGIELALAVKLGIVNVLPWAPMEFVR